MDYPWLIVIITLVFSAFFSGLEIAFISSNKLKIEVDKSQGSLSAKNPIAFHYDTFPFYRRLAFGQQYFLGHLWHGHDHFAAAVDRLFNTPSREPGILEPVPQNHRQHLAHIDSFRIYTKGHFFRIKPNAVLNVFFIIPMLVFFTTHFTR